MPEWSGSFWIIQNFGPNKRTLILLYTGFVFVLQPKRSCRYLIQNPIGNNRNQNLTQRHTAQTTHWTARSKSREVLSMPSTKRTKEKNPAHKICAHKAGSRRRWQDFLYSQLYVLQKLPTKALAQGSWKTTCEDKPFCWAFHRRLLKLSWICKGWMPKEMQVEENEVFQKGKRSWRNKEPTAPSRRIRSKDIIL